MARLKKTLMQLEEETIDAQVLRVKRIALEAYTLKLLRGGRMSDAKLKKTLLRFEGGMFVGMLGWLDLRLLELEDAGYLIRSDLFESYRLTPEGIAYQEAAWKILRILTAEGKGDPA